MKTSKQQAPTKTYRPSGFGVMTRIEAVVTDVTFVDGVVEAMVHMGVSEPMKVRFTIEQACEHDIIEKVE